MGNELRLGVVLRGSLLSPAAAGARHSCLNNPNTCVQMAAFLVKASGLQQGGRKRSRIKQHRAVMTNGWRRAKTILLAILVSGVAISAFGQDITEFAISTSTYLGGIASGPDGALWFTEQANKIGRISIDGTITEFTIPTAGSGPQGIVGGPDGRLWFTERSGSKIGRITVAGDITEFSIPTPNCGPERIAVGPDGALWFTESEVNKIGRITTLGEITEFPTLHPGSRPSGIAAGADGALWFTEILGVGASTVGRMTTTGEVTYFQTPTFASGPGEIAAGPDRSLWFTESYVGQIGRITTSGAITEFSIPTPFSEPWGITAGPDGAVWFTELGLSRVGKIGRITTAGIVTEFPTLTPDSYPLSIAAGSDGALWFTENAVSKIGRITTGPCAADLTTLCLNDGRFAVQVTWSAPPQGTSGMGSVVPLTGDTGYFWFFNRDNVELVIKVLDGTGINGHYWVFYGALSNVQYTLTVRDTVTGIAKTYENSYGNLASVADTSAFSPTGAALQPSMAPSKEIATRSAEELQGLYAALTRAVAPKIVPVGCTPDGTTLCLNQSRFQLTVDWAAPDQARSGHGTAVPLTDDTGYFWFFGDANVELVIKVLDGRGINEHFWVFYGALSDVQYTITVTDTQTQTVRTYTNPYHTLASVADTEAF